MNSGRASTDASVAVASTCAFAMIANQVAGKAVRDALFLTNFDVTALPGMIVGSSLLTIGVVLAASRILAARGPGLVSIAFGLSAAVTISIWSFVDRAPKAAAVALYLHVALFGAVLISWFWSLVTERFDPRTARKRIARIAAGGTLGGLLGGLAAERVGALFPVTTMLPVLALLQGVASVGAATLAGGAPPRSTTSPAAEPQSSSGLRTLSRIPYLRNLALLVMIGAVGAVFLDWVFKYWASSTFEGGAGLLRFFAIFYTSVAAATFLIQSSLTRPSLERLGLSHTASFLPMLVGAGGLAALAVPGLATAGAARGMESVARSSLFRSSYELFYAPIPPREKRASKTIVDVGFDRLGDVIGGLLVQGVLMSGAAASTILSAGAILLGVGGLALTRRLHRDYVTALETNLIGRASEIPTTPEDDAATRTAFLQTVAQLDLAGTGPELAADASSTALIAYERETREMPKVAAAPASRPAAAVEPLLVTAQQLRSGDPVQVRRALRDATPLPPELVPLVIPLLAWDDVASRAVQALGAVADRHCGQLVDALLDPTEDFTVRRRIPRVLSAATTERAVDGLVRGLGDRRFEVRHRCSVALARLHERLPDVAIGREAILQAVVREANVAPRVWERQRPLPDSPEEQSPFFDEAIRDRASRSLEHIFTMLSLVLPRRPLEIAYRGLYASDAGLRGTALEYLEVILPTEIREAIWSHIEDRRPAAPTEKSREEVLDSLLRSHHSIEIDLAEIRRRAQGTEPGG